MKPEIRNFDKFQPAVIGEQLHGDAAIGDRRDNADRQSRREGAAMPGGDNPVRRRDARARRYMDQAWPAGIAADQNGASTRGFGRGPRPMAAVRDGVAIA